MLADSPSSRDTESKATVVVDANINSVPSLGTASF